MNKKDYKAIAEIICKRYQFHSDSLKWVAEDLADYFEKEALASKPKEPQTVEQVANFNNSAFWFDKEAFLKKCGVIE